MKMFLRRREGGFTLVEVIVVLVILAILAAILIPSLTGYIDRARRRMIIAECRDCVMSAQTLCVETYASDSRAVPEPGEIQALAEVNGTVSNVLVSALMKIEHLTYTNSGLTVTYCALARQGGACHPETYNFEDGSGESAPPQEEPSASASPSPSPSVSPSPETGTAADLLSRITSNWDSFDGKLREGLVLSDGESTYIFYNANNANKLRPGETLDEYIARNPNFSSNWQIKLTADTRILTEADREPATGGGYKWKEKLPKGTVCYIDGEYYISTTPSQYEADPVSGSGWAKLSQ